MPRRHDAFFWVVIKEFTLSPTGQCLSKDFEKKWLMSVWMTAQGLSSIYIYSPFKPQHAFHNGMKKQDQTSSFFVKSPSVFLFSWIIQDWFHVLWMPESQPQSRMWGELRVHLAAGMFSWFALHPIEEKKLISNLCIIDVRKCQRVCIFCTRTHSSASGGLRHNKKHSVATPCQSHCPPSSYPFITHCAMETLQKPPANQCAWGDMACVWFPNQAAREHTRARLKATPPLSTYDPRGKYEFYPTLLLFIR